MTYTAIQGMSSQRVHPANPATRRRFANTEYWNVKTHFQVEHYHLPFYWLILICMMQHLNHLKGHISECVNWGDGTGGDAVQVCQHKVPEVLQL